MDKLKLKLSTKILDFVEKLPKSKKGIIADLQRIREDQKEESSEYFDSRKPPDNCDLELKQISLILTFEHDDFESISNGLKRYFPKNETIQEFINSLKKSENSLHAASWYNLGYITRGTGSILPFKEFDENLPEGIKFVSLSCERFLPSAICIIFEFNFEKSISERLNSIQEKNHIGKIVFKKFWPPQHITRGYSMSIGHNTATEALCVEKDSIRELIERWVKNGFNWKSETINTFSYIDAYKISGNPKNVTERKDWINNNNIWLSEYGILTSGFNTFEGKDFVLSKPESNNRKYIVSNVIAKFDSEIEHKFENFIGHKIRAIAISSAIFSLIQKHKFKIEALRGHGFKNLYSKKKQIIKTSSNIQDIKRTVTILCRLKSELKQSGHWIKHSITNLGTLKNTMTDESIDLGKYTIDGAKYQLRQVKEAADIIDTGLTDYLSVQSIYVMYKLQKWMFVLTIVVTIATIVGVLSGWENLKKLVSEFLYQ